MGYSRGGISFRTVLVQVRVFFVCHLAILNSSTLAGEELLLRTGHAGLFSVLPAAITALTAVDRYSARYSPRTAQVGVGSLTVSMDDSTSDPLENVNEPENGRRLSDLSFIEDDAADMFIEDLEPDEIQVIQEFRDLVKLYWLMPRDMFVTQIIRDYSSSEPDLERIRSDYFEHLKKVSTDFPYGSDAELKRRVFTRTGEPVTVKLAQDIHTIISVVEGGDYGALKPLISTCRARKPSVPSTTQPQKKSTSCVPTSTCSCSTELKIVKETMAGLQADILLLKQTLHASDRLRNEQSKCTNAGINDIRNDILQCNGSVKKFVSDTELTVRNLTSTLVQRITELEDRIRLLESFIDTEEIVTLASVKNVNISPTVENEESNLMNSPVAQDCETGSIRPLSLSESSIRKPNAHPHTSGEHGRKHGVNTATLNVGNNSACPVPGSVDDGNPIPVRITRRLNESSTVGIDEEGYSPRRRKGTKRYCVLGMSRKVNVNVLTSVINKKGPKVTNIRVFQMRRDPEKVLLRLNVQADDKADMVLSDNFWPDYIKCRPWNVRRPIPYSSQRTHVPPRLRQTGRRLDTEMRYSDYVTADDYCDLLTANRFECLNLASDVD